MSQEDKILSYLQSGKSLTSWEAIQLFRCTRLSGRIFDLRQKGYNIQSHLVCNDKKHFEEYWLSDEPIPTEQEQAICHSNKIAENRINFKEIEKQMAWL